MPVEFVEQRVQRGTGDAVSVALTAFADDLDLEDDVIVMPGDAPLLRPEILATLATEHRQADAAATLLTAGSTTRTGSAGSSATTRAGSTASSSRPTPPPRSSRSTRSTRRSTASGAACSRPRCGG